MRVVVLADIHSNLEALLRVEKKIKQYSPDKVICLGDIIGYGARPSECIEIVRKNSWEAIAGNHEYGVLEKKELSFFSSYAREAIFWTRSKISLTEKIYLRSLELIYNDEDFWGVHSSFYQPSEFFYLDNYSAIYRDLKILKNADIKIGFVAHTHTPFVFIYKADNLYRDYSREVPITLKNYYLINVGSVGQPRDRDNRACFCILDLSKMLVKFERVEYNIKKTQREIKSSGLPSILAERLQYGW